ncbi:exodeoxyribonuclease V subunit alpha [Cellulomonas gilvus]|uniref:RecBCD enzyme subunit RecD n=1 Tax=Cellulomonas gilvus (strain ATCC 13127 / NRRL B-14078) TaxID=593907 RepID=F8A108_CELGA|nr:exodeoxyribonuclease V subunit alpha [Cellulomonas gilvus]AEI12766.1 exodeoxyribonuclease V, alpha subunit [Cellulomonas gilvus ATCC 13127]
MSHDVTLGGQGAVPGAFPGARDAARAWSGDASPDVPWHTEGLLAPFVAARVLTSADVHVARRVTALCGEADESVQLAAALAVRALRAGSVCVVLADVAATVVEPTDDDAGSDPLPAPFPGTPGVAPEPDGLPWPETGAWTGAVRASPAVADGADGPPDRPLRWTDGRLYLDRYWCDEVEVAEHVAARLEPVAVDEQRLTAAVQRLFPDAADDRQRAALRTAATSRLTVLTGGPGTGKTTTVARLVAALQDVAGPGLRVALAAPTGKAAARLQESVTAELQALPLDADRAAAGELRASTVHRLLGHRPGSSTRFGHDARHRLPHDVVVVDECSMMSLPLMARLLEAVRPQARVVLVGDAHQLASVEAGAVLGDLVASLPHGVVELTREHRFGAELAALAHAIREGDADRTVALLTAGGAAVEWVPTAGDAPTAREAAGLEADVRATGAALVAAARAGAVDDALHALGEHRLLLAHRHGPAGVAHWTDVVEEWVAQETGGRSAAPYPPGRPLIVTRNDRSTGLYNGDTGVVVETPDGVAVAFGAPGAHRLVAPYRLPPARSVHAMTVHRGQGSQFTRVSVVLPPAASPLLTRELLYTAVTRARTHLRVIGSEAAVRAAVQRPVQRASGLAAGARPVTG